ncbi:hypothetical protein GUJ93_ZPchr0014g46972 [Zizania palustris]|uniref:Uncharacterized protein n=1 Tax=Zizania palustris TaxID=103762 RepID=A0A8J5TC05_ZIZPA|nr:hypothetical protein GUJ93_ZPchr0014g46972 [Zizania palustris]
MRPFAAGDYPAGQVDPDYLYFLRHIRTDGNSYSLELPPDGASPPLLIKYEAPAVSTDGECVSDPSPGGASTNRRTEEKDSSVEATSWVDSLVDIDEDYRLFLKHTRVVNDSLVLEIDGVVVNYPCAACSEGSSEVEDGPGKGEKEAGINSDEPVVVIPDPKVCASDPTAVKTPESGENVGLLNASGQRTSEMKTIPSNGNDAGPSVPSRLQGVIWPTHINSRSDSDFKRRLMDVLRKPCSKREYLKLFDMASIRTPLVKLRQVRNDAKFYPTEEMGNSYFDHYPDLVDQVIHTSYINGLALMRGFFFWLQNNAHEDQFRPWVDDSKDAEVIPLLD